MPLLGAAAGPSFLGGDALQARDVLVGLFKALGVGANPYTTRSPFRSATTSGFSVPGGFEPGFTPSTGGLAPSPSDVTSADLATAMSQSIGPSQLGLRAGPFNISPVGSIGFNLGRALGTPNLVTDIVSALMPSINPLSLAFPALASVLGPAGLAISGFNLANALANAIAARTGTQTVADVMRNFRDPNLLTPAMSQAIANIMGNVSPVGRVLSVEEATLIGLMHPFAEPMFHTFEQGYVLSPQASRAFAEAQQNIDLQTALEQAAAEIEGMVSEGQPASDTTASPDGDIGID
jgi:hypothetical protein